MAALVTLYGEYVLVSSAYSDLFVGSSRWGDGVAALLVGLVPVAILAAVYVQCRSRGLTQRQTTNRLAVGMIVVGFSFPFLIVFVAIISSPFLYG